MLYVPFSLTWARPYDFWLNLKLFVGHIIIVTLSVLDNGLTLPMYGIGEQERAPYMGMSSVPKML